MSGREAQLTELEHDLLQSLLLQGLKDMFIYGLESNWVDLHNHVDSQEYSWVDNNRLFYRLFQTYRNSFIPTFQNMALKCANQRFPDMGFRVVDSLYEYSHADSGLWGFEVFLHSANHGNSHGVATRYSCDDDSCCIVITNRIKDTRAPNSLSVITLNFVNPEFTAPRYRQTTQASHSSTF